MRNYREVYTPVERLRVGDVLYLHGDSIVDPNGDHPGFWMEYAVVQSVDTEWGEIAIGYTLESYWLPMGTLRFPKGYEVFVVHSPR